ncbi:hypothetical protein [Pedobacter montanisoli]|uniref:Bacteriocin n=1 Tax=Pedobacter montanisoli TaxID=2923277 RepID=A0ABS9ZY61_9SPHI|nr:hypothetical protein [Pedobacter montanisoli]MCJ0743232.1 hypothetical protein [Pedobacter montanisoli]
MNLLSRAEMKKVMGGGSAEPGDPGNSSCEKDGKGYISCVSPNGPSYDYPDMCCTSLAQAQSFCPSGWIYGCVMPDIPPIE